jgi:peptide/nickel transport system substrate-binding protein
VPGVAKGKADTIDVRVSSDVNQMTQDVIDGKLDFMTEDPTGDLLREVRDKYGDRFRLDANPPNTYYFFLNSTTPPFDKLEARQAVNYAIDSRALQRIMGGRLEPTCNFLPPAMAGYEETDPCPWGDPAGPGNVAKAKSLVQSAGLTGSKVTVWTDDKAPRPQVGDNLRDTLNAIGFDASVKVVNNEVYFETVGKASTKAQIGFTNWLQDFPHPYDFFGTQLAAASRDFGTNLGFVNDPQLDAKSESLRNSDPKAVASEWAALDRSVAGPEKAYVAVYGNEKASTFMSERMNFDECSGTPHLVYRNDWSQFCLKD